jgi:A/G-specific adenine glycosylase
MPDALMPVDRAREITNNILSHYAAHARVLPWRSLPGAAPPDPYRVWLSEIMLQQTTVAAVKPYFERFTSIWPNVRALAGAADEDVMQAWAGLGYYARARNLLACARAVCDDHGGAFPDEEATLLRLPGVGTYTAAAIAAIAFGKRAVVVDGNVERVIARVFAIRDALPAAKPIIRGYMDQITPADRAGDFAQAVMDLGATICTPRSPECVRCPIASACQGKGTATDFPVKATKAAKPQRSGTAWWIERTGQVFLIQRPPKGLLGGMRALPTCNWDGMVGTPPIAASWTHAGTIDHVFTHFSLTLAVHKAEIDESAAQQLFATDHIGLWWPIDQISDAGLPSVFAKAALRATGGLP